MAGPTGLPEYPANSGQGGFALLEGLVAIALLAGTMVSIFALVGNILNSAARVGRSNASVQVAMNAVEVMTTVNPMVQGSGKIDLGPYTVTWTSAAIAPVVDRSRQRLPDQLICYRGSRRRQAWVGDRKLQASAGRLSASPRSGAHTRRSKSPSAKPGSAAVADPPFG